MCTQEHWSRMFAISKRYWFRPASPQALLKRGIWVLGEQDATTTLVSLWFFMADIISDIPDSEHV